MSHTIDAFVGIDVAFAKGKRLPVSISVREPDGLLQILPLRGRFATPPAGRGNVEALDPDVRRQFAGEVWNWLRDVEEAFGVRIRRIAIDAPGDYCRDPSGRRASERCLDRSGISCFATPTEASFENKIRQAREFLAAGNPANRLPNANQIWMLVGFQLFRTLGEQWECIETYPQAIVHQLGCSGQHKSTETGLRNQMEAAAGLMGLDTSAFQVKLDQMGFGSRHDRLDAFLSAWVASLDDLDRYAFGSPPLDAIWAPAIRKQVS